jgi:spermidine synthase
VAEVALARLALATVEGGQLDVLVGGLGLGFTARAALDDPRVRSLVVVELYDAVVGWHRDDLVRGGADLLGDDRCRVEVGDFFALVGEGALADQPGSFDAVLVDIDHAPDRLLRAEHAGFYQERGLQAAARLLAPGGCFGLWSDDAPDDGFLTRLGEVFARAQAEVVPFSSPYHQVEATNTVYLAGDPLLAERRPEGP